MCIRAEMEMAPVAVTLIALILVTMSNEVKAIRFPSHGTRINHSIPPRSAFLLCWPGRCGAASTLWDEASKRAPYYSFGLGKRDDLPSSLESPDIGSQYLDDIEQNVPLEEFTRTMSKRSRMPKKNSRNDYQRFSFGLGKRKREVASKPQENGDIPDDVESKEKRARGYKGYQFGLGKRDDVIPFDIDKKDRTYRFGLGKKDKMYGFGLGKRDKMYGFGLGKKDKMYGFGLGKRDKMYGFGLGKRDKMYGFGLGKRLEYGIEDSVRDDSNTQSELGESVLSPSRHY